MNIRASLIIAASLFSFSIVGVAGDAFAQLNIQQEAVTGGVAGAIIGGIVGNQNDETAEGVAIGGVVGAIAGNVLGNSRDRQIQQQFEHQQAIAQRRQFEHQQIQQAQQVQFQRALSIDDAISLSQSGVSPQLILNQIDANGVQQEIGVSEIIVLSQNGVSEVVIDAMQKASIGGPAPVVVDDGSLFYDKSPVVVSPRPVVIKPRPVVVSPRPVVVARPVGYHSGRGHRSYRPAHRPHHARSSGGFGATIRIR